MTHKEEFAAALGVEPDEITIGDFDTLEYRGEQADGEGHWALTESDTIHVEFGCLSMNVDVLHSIAATVAALRAANAAVNDTIGAAVKETP